MSDKWMTCTTCKAIVQFNNTGICLGCQGGFSGQQDEDRYLPIDTKLRQQKDDTSLRQEDVNTLKKREKELEDALQKPSTEKVYVQPASKASKGVRSCNSKRKKAPNQSKTKEKE